MTVINTNISANIARDAIGRNDRAMATSMERLSTGLRINSAKDDAAGLAIANRMAGQISGLNMAKRNANDGISMIQTIEGATKEVGSMLVRMRELAVQSASGTYSDSDRAALDLEFDALRSEITRIQEKTTWNNQALMDNGNTVNIQLGASSGQTMGVTFADWSMVDTKVYGSASSPTAGVTESALVTFTDIDNDAVGDGDKVVTVAGLTLTIAEGTANAAVTDDLLAAAFANLSDGATSGGNVTGGTWSGKLAGFSTGAASTNTVTFTSSTDKSDVTNITSSGVTSAVTTAGKAANTIDTISIHNTGGAAAAITALDAAITGVTAEQAKYGAYLSRLQYASDNIGNVATNLDQSRSRIQDADYAIETTALARTQIIAQASTAMLAQANQVKQTVLALLQ
jgi:flagellin